MIDDIQENRERLPLMLTLFGPDPFGQPQPGPEDLQSIEEVVRRAVEEAFAAAAAEPKMYFNIKEAAEHLTISPSQLREQVAEGELPPPVSVGGCKRYTREQLDGIRRTAMIQTGFRNF